MGVRGRWVRRCSVAIAVVLAAAACSGDDSGDTSLADRTSEVGGLTIELLSSRTETVTGGNALVAVSLPEGSDHAEVEITTNGIDVSAQLALDGDRLVGRIDGFDIGENEIVATLGGESTDLTVINHPISGPVFSGPHFPLYACTTESFDLPPSTVDDNCQIDPVVRWVYATEDGETVPLDDPTSVPTDAVSIGVDGEELPFIVRQEWGTINRAIYRIDVLDPDPDPDRVWDSGAWNGRLVYQFGGGCGTAYTQGFFLGNQLQPSILAEGYATATSTFNTHQVMCNETLSAETASMVKEHFIENYGVPEFTIGSGGSGGSIQQYVIADTYPGLLDGLTPSLPFSDLSVGAGALDCGLLQRFYATPSGSEWSPEQRAATNGHLSATSCQMWDLLFVPAGLPARGCNPMEQFQGAAATGIGEGFDLGIPQDMPTIASEDVFGESNPDGLRCTLPDANVNIFGIDPETGWARYPFDNLAVQYGLVALSDGVITVDQFLDLNEQIGSIDLAGNPVPVRAVITEDTARVPYETGRIVTGGGGLADVPVISIDVWSDDQGDFHTRSWAFVIDERLEELYGGPPPNHTIWTRGRPGTQSPLESVRGGGFGIEAILAVDEWLVALAADDSGDPLAEKLDRARPESAIDNCIAGDGERIASLTLYDEPGPCSDRFPVSGDPRVAAGGPTIANIVKCERQAVDAAFEAGVYGVEFSDEQRARLDAQFPDGVCDYAQRGVGQVPPRGPWLSYGS